MLFFRSGTEFTGQPIDSTGKPFAVVIEPCHRCGGQGGADAWKHTGWKCFRCGGNGKEAAKQVPLFTAEKLAQLNATAAKKAAKKAAVAEAARMKAEAETEARRVVFNTEFGALLTEAEAFQGRSDFIKDVCAKARAKAALTVGQADALRAAIARFQASDAKAAASGHVGSVGERREFTVKLERMFRTETQFGSLFIASMRDTAGNAIVAKGSFVPAAAGWNRETERWDIDPEQFTIKATVKDHGEFRGEKQTIVNRVKEAEAVPAQEAA